MLTLLTFEGLGRKNMSWILLILSLSAGATPYDYVLLFDGDKVQSWSSTIGISMFNTHTSPFLVQTHSQHLWKEKFCLVSSKSTMSVCLHPEGCFYAGWTKTHLRVIHAEHKCATRTINIDWFFTASWRHCTVSVWTVSLIFILTFNATLKGSFFSICPCVSAFSSAQFLFCFTLLAGHLLTAAVLQLFAFIIMRSHFKQPAALYLNHLQWTGERDRLMSYAVIVTIP